ncbi:2'-5' RNA ligase [Dyadobacter sp. BE34]|uniref:2'-5' RNA ligase n=1 Tax=Dyadobacter fermentans TaxID=94254 RepID=A0ABU1QT32_9BACT|nr:MULTISPECIES: 2'-5' RNA ligase family protein [Dyadobacter]MDR6804292.1 2'-5' RNA ligase [Dyadobacter fermentans]MDR7042032.1 2'-5' RNA ligase [Dyadobacter sp. BE242]MDR7196435.1 2'-5' RNA ligase [Dyadobacter sp. BE34]MDR7213020.1 2'-5' RNA ligase [Dyadobacter sp. BE31]MDR7261841.1 2'-5' RNA ligase [Dyadobacter sp. BE32]
MKSIHFNNNDLSTIRNIREHLYEYLLVFSCDPVTEATIGSVKQYFQKAYGCEQAANLRPHLTLFNCVIHEYKLERVIHGFEKVARHIAPFRIELNGFNKYEGGTFYVDLEEGSSQQVNGLVKTLKSETVDHLSKWASGEFRFCTDPHVTVARKMTPLQVNSAAKEWMYKKFRSSFRVTEMILLKRSLVSGSKCREIARMPLLGLPGEAFVQGSLF